MQGHLVLDLSWWRKKVTSIGDSQGYGVPLRASMVISYFVMPSLSSIFCISRMAVTSSDVLSPSSGPERSGASNVLSLSSGPQQSGASNNKM